jgi:hypothetical protein
MKILENEAVRWRTRYRAEGCCRSGFDGGAVSLAGRAFFKSHRHKGQRVATEYTMWPNALHSVLGQALIVSSTHCRIPRLISAGIGSLKRNTSTTPGTG